MLEKMQALVKDDATRHFLMLPFLAGDSSKVIVQRAKGSSRKRISSISGGRCKRNELGRGSRLDPPASAPAVSKLYNSKTKLLDRSKLRKVQLAV